MIDDIEIWYSTVPGIYIEMMTLVFYRNIRFALHCAFIWENAKTSAWAWLFRTNNVIS